MAATSYGYIPAVFNIWNEKKKIHYDAIINAHWLIEIKNQNTIQRTLLEIESMKPANESDHDWIE